MRTHKNRIIVETEYLGANVSCIRTKKGLVLVDSPFLPADARSWAARIREETGQGVAFQINTDHHFDHVMGNGFLTDSIICHSTAAKGIKAIRNKQTLREIIRGSFPDVLAGMDREIEELPIPSPLITFDQKLTLDLEDATIVLEFVGGHSPGTILVHLVEDKVVFTGDNVEGQFPYFGQGRFNDWKKTLRKILAMDIDLVVPGHGEVGGKEMVETYLAFFQSLEDEVKGFARDGYAVEQMVERSQAIGFFPPSEEVRRSWVEEQYKFVAKQILADQ